MRSLRAASPHGRTRRDFLRLSARAGTSFALGIAGLRAQAAVGKFDEPVAIVGGGIAGLTAAYRLMKAGVAVHLYEAQERFGGRMFTKRDFNKEGMFVELGGELVDTNHEELIALAKELNVPLQNLKEGDAGLDFYYFGGQTYTDHEAIAAFAPLASRLAADAEGLYDDKEAFTDKARSFDKISLKQYLSDAGKGTPPWLLQLLEVAYVPELGLDADQLSSLNLIDFINPDTSKGFQVFGDSDESWRVQGGNDTLPTAVHAAIKDKVKCIGGHRLRKIRREDDGRLHLEFSTRSGGIIPSYTHVVMALPFTILRTIAGVSELGLSAPKLRAIREMGYGTNVKAMHGFTGKPWRTPAEGRTFFSNGAVFSDLPFQNAWETSRGQQGTSAIITNFMGGTTGAKFTPARLEEFPKELDTVFPGVQALRDGNHAVMNWPSVKTMLGSYSCPKVGQYTWVYEAAATPELDGHLIFAGEHTSSTSPGFMNGGVQSGNRAAEELLATRSE